MKKLLCGSALILLTCAYLKAQTPPNDDFADRIIVTNTSPTSVAGTTMFATPEFREVANHSVWYEWRSTTTQEVQIKGTTEASTLSFFVFRGDALTELEFVAESPNFEPVVFTALANTPYAISVLTEEPDLDGDFTLEFVPDPRPGNDNFANRALLPQALPLEAESSTILASVEQGEPEHAAEDANNEASNSVWWEWSPAEDGLYLFELEADDFDAVLAIYTGTDLATLSPVASIDTGGVNSEFILLSLQGGETYVIVADGYRDSQDDEDPESGAVILRISQAPLATNDNFADRRVLSGVLPIADDSSTVGATREDNDPEVAGEEVVSSIWWEWTASVSGLVRIAASAPTHDVILGLFAGSDHEDLVLIKEADEGGIGEEFVVADVIAGATYFILVSGYDEDEVGAVELSLQSGSLPGDAFSDAIPITAALPLQLEADNRGYTTEPDEPNYGQEGLFASGNSIWWRWTAPESRNYRLELPNNADDQFLAIYRGDTLAGLEIVGFSNRSQPTGNPSYNEAITFAATAGEEYYFLVDGETKDGVPGRQGHIELELTLGGPLNDDIADRKILGPHFPTIVRGNFDDATLERIEFGFTAGTPQNGITDYQKTVWYSYTAMEDGMVELDLAADHQNAVLLVAARDGAFLPRSRFDFGLELAMEEKEKAGKEFSGTTFFSVTAGKEYFFMVGSLQTIGAEPASGEFILEVRELEHFDSFASPKVLSPDFGGNLPMTSFQIGELTVEENEPDHAIGKRGHTNVATLWLEWTPAESGLYQVTIDAGRHVLAVYTGSELGDLTEIVTSDRPSKFDPEFDTLKFPDFEVADFYAEAGTTYRIAVDRLASVDHRSTIINFHKVAQNDTPQSSRTLVLDHDVSTSNAGLAVPGVSTNIGEQVRGNQASNALYWDLILPENGEYMVEAAGIDQDIVLGVGSKDEDDISYQWSDRPGLESENVIISGVAGTKIFVVIDGYSTTGEVENSGRVRMLVSKIIRDGNDLRADAHEIPAKVPYYIIGTTDGASASDDDIHLPFQEISFTGEPNQPSNTVWFTWTPEVSGYYSLEVATRQFEPAVAIYQTENLAAQIQPHHITPYGGWSSGTKFSGISYDFFGEAGTSYTILIDSFSAQRNVTERSGEFYININQNPPSNDDLADARRLVADAPVLNKLTNATVESGELARAGNPPLNSGWWFIDIFEDSALTLSLTPLREGNATLGIYRGNFASRGFEDIEEMTSVDYHGDAEGEQANFNVSAGERYFIAVDTAADTEFSKGRTFLYQIEAQFAVRQTNDSFENRTVLLGALPLVGESHTTEATRQEGEPEFYRAVTDLANEEANVASNSVWWEWTAGNQGAIKVILEAQGHDAVLEVFTGTSFESLTPIDFILDDEVNELSLIIDPIEGETYYFVADGYSTDGEVVNEGAVKLSLRDVLPRPQNDDFSGRFIMAGDLPLMSSSTTQGATTDVVGETAIGEAIWWEWTASSDTRVSIQATGGELDLVLYAYVGDGLNNLELIAFTNNNTPPGEVYTFDAEADRTYQFAVATNNNVGEGAVTISIIEEEPTKDGFDVWLDSFQIVAGENRLRDAAPGGDGIENQMKFLLGLNPLLPLAEDPNGDHFPTIVKTAEGPKFRFKVSGENLDLIGQRIIYRIEHSTDLSLWHPIVATLSEDGYHYAQARQATDRKSFFRLIVDIDGVLLTHEELAGEFVQRMKREVGINIRLVKLDTLQFDFIVVEDLDLFDQTLGAYYTAYYLGDYRPGDSLADYIINYDDDFYYPLTDNGDGTYTGFDGRGKEDTF